MKITDTIMRAAILTVFGVAAGFALAVYVRRDPAPPPPPVLTLPAEVKGEAVVEIKPEHTANRILWLIPPGQDFQHQHVGDSLVVYGRDGKYLVGAIAVKGTDLHGPQWCHVTLGKPKPPPPPVPPVPPVPPTPPPSPAPIPKDGFRVLIIYESMEKMTPVQASILGSSKIREYLNAKCAKGPDSRTPEYRIVDKDSDASGEDVIWQNAMRRPRTAVPWLIISTGKDGYEGTLPGSVDETLSLLKKYGG